LEVTVSVIMSYGLI